MLPDTLFLPGYLSTIPTILKKKFFWSFLESGEEYSWTPFGQRPSQGSHLFTPFFSTSILSEGQLLTHEVPSTKKLAKQRKQKLSPITTWTTFVARIKAKEKLKFKLRKKKKKITDWQKQQQIVSMWLPRSLRGYSRGHWATQMDPNWNLALGLGSSLKVYLL